MFLKSFKAYPICFI